MVGGVASWWTSLSLSISLQPGVVHVKRTGTRVIAQHLTRIDIKLILGELCSPEAENSLECTGLELLTLPQGRIFRSDLIERTQCLKLLVTVTILTCQSDLERAETLNKWIQVAIDTKTALGNLYGFCAIMLGLACHRYKNWIQHGMS